MKKTKFSESQIVAILKEVELGAKVGETCRKHGVSEPTYYKWKSQFSGMTVPHLAQLRELQDENARLKRMYADLALMHNGFEGRRRPKALTPERRDMVVQSLMADHGMS